MWWHGWDREKDLDAIARSLIAGHLPECSAYICGGYFSGFKNLLDNCENIGFPIGEVDHLGQATMGKEPGTGNEISVGTCTSQLLYEIQGPQYFGSDAVANLEGIQMKQLGKDRVLVSGTKGLTARIRVVTLGSNFTARIFCQVSFCRCKISGLELIF